MYFLEQWKTTFSSIFCIGGTTSLYNCSEKAQLAHVSLVRHRLVKLCHRKMIFYCFLHLRNGSIEQYSPHNLVNLPLPAVVVSKSRPVKSSERSFYTVFSTDCMPFQDWQSIVLFHSAMAVGQKGFVVRIASGCSNEKSQQLHALYKKLFPDRCPSY